MAGRRFSRTEVELARAVALANLKPPGVEELANLGRAEGGPAGHDRIVAHSEFADEIARALREPAPFSEERASRPQGWAWIYRPADGLETAAKFDDAQRALRELLAVWLSGTPQSAFKRSRTRMRLRVDVDFFPAEARRPGGSVARAKRQMSGRPQLQLRYIAAPGRDTFVFAILQAADVGVLSRLSLCDACGRYIIGRTEKPVHTCAREVCRGTASGRSSKEPTSRVAAYQKRRRQRQADWIEFERKQLGRAVSALRAASSEAERNELRRALTEAISTADKLLPICFPRKKSRERATAELLVTAAWIALQNSNEIDRKTGQL